MKSELGKKLEVVWSEHSKANLLISEKNEEKEKLLKLLDKNEEERKELVALLGKYENLANTTLALASEEEFVEYIKECSATAPEWYTKDILEQYEKELIDREKALRRAQDYEHNLLLYLEDIATPEQYFAIVYSRADLLRNQIMEEGFSIRDLKDESLETLLCIYPQLIKDAPEYGECMKHLEEAAPLLLQAEQTLKEKGEYEVHIP